MELTHSTDSVFINLGPVHPSTHGVFRMRAQIDGEVITDIEPVFGYLHRGIEKLAEGKTYRQIIPLTDRLDYLSSMSNNLAYCMAVEKLAEIEVPERAVYIRVIMSELQRMMSHLLAVGSFFNDMGTFFTPFFYMFIQKEKITDLFEMVSGQRLLYNYMRFGGVSHDLPDAFIPALKRFLSDMPAEINKYEHLLNENEIVLARSKNVGILSRETAINCSVSGPLLRASGVNWDIRKADPYSGYDRFDFDIPVGANGDCYDRYLVRIRELRQSLRIIEQAVNKLSQGKVLNPVPLRFRPPAGEVYSHIESTKGELGFHVVSDGSDKPYRLHVRAPSLINLSALRQMLIGWKLADAIITFGSIDICLAEVDR
ncbi:MAG: NADH-quinone oxidoreductase subunit D [Dehalococcoidales bacterium]|nr:NADH-quinone oxidoreductase subunit D [Dehalococcoidales bacterium]MDD5402728.1 NADH-quinone oxidoreductase subunit D [Dehalococcoidales bacterium]